MIIFGGCANFRPVAFFKNPLIAATHTQILKTNVTSKVLMIEQNFWALYPHFLPRGIQWNGYLFNWSIPFW